MNRVSKAGFEEEEGIVSIHGLPDTYNVKLFSIYN